MKFPLPVLLLVSCSRSPERMFVGQWKQNAGPMRLDVRRDGLLTLKMQQQSIMGRWKFIDEKTVEITPAAGSPERYQVEFKGDLLLIIAPKEAWEFKRSD